jgi:ferrous-iron efflux pump FieF
MHGHVHPHIAIRERAGLMRAATWASLVVALGLVLAKSWAWRTTDSVSLLGSLADSALDLFASLLTFFAVRLSLSPADAEHRFGHGKSEGLTALLQGVLVAASSLFVAAEAVQRWTNPAPLTQPETGVAVMLVATMFTLALVAWQRSVSRRTGSVAIAADALHYKSDLLVNLSVLLALGAVGLGAAPWLDPLVGLGVAVWLAYGAMRIGAQSLDILLDRELPEEDRARIRELALAHPQVRGFHDLRTRHGGGGYIVQFHLELDPDTTLLETHHILDAVEAEIEQAFPRCEVLIHPDPVGLAERRDDFVERRAQPR